MEENKESKILVDIITIGHHTDEFVPEEHDDGSYLEKRNATNKIKGVAQQKIIKECFGFKNEDISIKKCLTNFFKDNKDKYYKLNKEIKINEKIYSKNSLLRSSMFSDGDKIYTKYIEDDKTYKVCNFCGQKIKTKNQWSRKCRKCNIGNFCFEIQEVTYWNIKCNYVSKEIILDFLISNGYMVEIPISKRIDFFSLKDGILKIFESKNKEKSGLSQKDIIRTCIYPLIFRSLGFEVKELEIIYNGTIGDNIISTIETYEQMYNININPIVIGSYFKKNNFKKVSCKVIRAKTKGERHIYELYDEKGEQMVINII